MTKLKARVKQHLRDQTLLHDGATVLNPFGLPCVPLDGFVVGWCGFTTDYIILNDDEKWESIMQLTEEQLGPLMVGVTQGIGTWCCDNRAHIHIDAIIWTGSREHARAMCLIHNQLAYYDIEQGESVYVRTNENEDTSEKVE